MTHIYEKHETGQVVLDGNFVFTFNSNTPDYVRKEIISAIQGVANDEIIKEITEELEEAFTNIAALEEENRHLEDKVYELESELLVD